MTSRKFLSRGSWLAAFALLLLQLSVFAHACDGFGEARAKCPDHAAAATCKAHCDASTPGKVASNPVDAAPASLPTFAAPVASDAARTESPGPAGPAVRVAPHPAYILLHTFRS